MRLQKMTQKHSNPSLKIQKHFLNLTKKMPNKSKKIFVPLAVVLMAYLTMIPSSGFAADEAVSAARDTGSISGTANDNADTGAVQATPAEISAPSASPTASKPVEIKVIEVTEPAPPAKSVSDSPPEEPPKKQNTAAMAIGATAVLGALAFAISKMFGKGSAEKTDEKANSRCTDIKSMLDQKLKELEDTAKSWPEDKLKALLIEKILTEEQKVLLKKYEAARAKFENLKKAADILRGKYDLCVLNLPKSRQKKVFIIHGCPSNAEGAMNSETRTYDKHWIPWLKKELVSREINTETPLMPEPWNPDYQKFKKEFEKYEISENDVLIGHSCGCAFLVRWLGETKKKISKLILVAPWKINNTGDEFRKDFYEYPVDESIKSRVKEIIMFTADDEDDSGKESLKLFHQALGGEIVELKNRGHYTFGDMGTEEFPELLDAILK